MAFIRRFMAQGDPFGRSFYQAGRFVVRSPLPRPRSGPNMPSSRFVIPSHPGGFLRNDPLAGDPFLGKLFKKAGQALKKVTLKGVVKGIGNVAKAALPLVVPGIGGAIAGAVLGGGGGAPPAQEQMDVEAIRAQFQAEAEQQLAADRAAAQQQIEALQAAHAAELAQHRQAIETLWAHLQAQ